MKGKGEIETFYVLGRVQSDTAKEHREYGQGQRLRNRKTNMSTKNSLAAVVYSMVQVSLSIISTLLTPMPASNSAAEQGYRKPR